MRQDILREVSKDIGLPTIMGTKRGILALVDLIEKSGAFTRTGKLRKNIEMLKFDEEPEPVDRNDPWKKPIAPQYYLHGRHTCELLVSRQMLALSSRTSPTAEPPADLIHNP
ncbi:hypothetical protein C8J56DRAFT_935989 [Mycena floridula]|nr:hypothetical protein C8J56DRAFT_935989 [Mycena floridula]